MKGNGNSASIASGKFRANRIMSNTINISSLTQTMLQVGNNHPYSAQLEDLEHLGRQIEFSYFNKVKNSAVEEVLHLLILNQKQEMENHFKEEYLDSLDTLILLYGWAYPEVYYVFSYINQCHLWSNAIFIELVKILVQRNETISQLKTILFAIESLGNTFSNDLTVISDILGKTLILLNQPDSKDFPLEIIVELAVPESIKENP